MPMMLPKQPIMSKNLNLSWPFCELPGVNYFFASPSITSRRCLQILACSDIM